MSEENNEDFNNLDNLELQNGGTTCFKNKKVLVIIIILILVIICATGVVLSFFIFS